MAKEVKMNAETGKVGAKKDSNTPIKAFHLHITLNSKGELKIDHDGKGFNDYEIFGFLETVKTSLVSNLLNTRIKQ